MEDIVNNKDYMTVEQIGSVISDIINQDGDEVSDGNCIDQIVEYLRSNNLYKERE